MNSLITRASINHGRQYMYITLHTGYNDYQEFEEFVLQSLSENVPVAIAYQGRTNQVRAFYGSERHFIAIIGVEGTGEDATYKYIDPANGSISHFRQDWLATLFENVSFMAFHRPPGTDLNMYEPSDAIEIDSDCELSVALRIDTFCVNMMLGSSRRKRSSHNYNVCPALSTTNPFSEPPNLFYVWYHFPHNGIQVKLTLKTALAIEKFAFANTADVLKEYILMLFKQMKQSAGLIAVADSSDLVLARDVLIEGFYPQFHDQLILAEKMSLPFIFIQTYRSYDFEAIRDSFGTPDEVIYAANSPKIELK
jgi:hypothetical protein